MRERVRELARVCYGRELIVLGQIPDLDKSESGRQQVQLQQRKVDGKKLGFKGHKK